MDSKWLRVIGLVLLLGVVAALEVGCSSGGSQRIAALRQVTVDEARRAGLARLEQAYATARYHQERVEDVAVQLASAKHNVDAIVYAGELVAKAGFHTMVLLPVAESAAKAKRDLPEFSLLVELALRKLSESQAVIDLAAQAALADSDAAEAELRQQLAALAATAECATVDEAIARVDGMLESIKDAAAQ